MKIILFRDKLGSRYFELSAWAAVAVLLLGAIGLVGDAWLVSRYFEGELLESQVVAAWQARLDEQQRSLERIRDESEVEMGAIGRRLASMQARLMRMEALGERITEVAKLDKSEFSFGEAPALGGPEGEPGTGFGSEAKFVTAVDDLAAELKVREDELEVLESLLSNRRFHEAIEVAGRPITKGWMSSGFGRRVDPFSGQPAWHAGLDFAGTAGADVVAVASGVVTFAGERSGYGRMIEINHGSGYSTRYGHHKKLLVSAGDVVKKGQVIGKMGSTGRSTGPHVHFEVLKYGRPIDPARYVARRR